MIKSKFHSVSVLHRFSCWLAVKEKQDVIFFNQSDASHLADLLTRHFSNPLSDFTNLPIVVSKNAKMY